MADPARAQRLAKRISSIVASAIAHDIKDPLGVSFFTFQALSYVLDVCRKEIPAFSAMSQKYADKGVQFVGISIDTPKNVVDFQVAQKVAYPLVIASPSVVSLTEELGNTSQGLPFTLILDRKGGVSLVKLGTLSEEELDRKLADFSKS